MCSLKQLCVLCVVLILCVGSHVSADPRIDSIRHELPRLNDDQRLLALSNIARIAHSGDDMDTEVGCIHDYLNEARRLNAVDAEGDASLSLLYCFDNYERPDSIMHYLPEFLERMKTIGAMDYYYNCWDAAIEHYIFHDKPESAIREARKMYDEAKKAGSNYGLGVAAFDIGLISQCSGRAEEAAKSFEESIQALSKEGDITILLSAYNHLASSLDALGQYDRLYDMAVEWKGVLDDYREKAIAKGYMPEQGGKRLYNSLAFCVAEMGRGDMDRAGEYLAQAQEYAKGRSASSQYRLMQIEGRYYAAAGQYDRAIDIDRKNLALLEEVGDSVSVATIKAHLSEVLFNAGRFEESAEMYRELLVLKNKINDEELAHRLDELRTVYEVDVLTSQAHAANVRLLYSIVILSLLAIVIGILIVYQHRLKQKNRALYHSILAINEAKFREKQSSKSPEESPMEEPADRDEAIYRKVCSLMDSEHIFKDPSLNRESLSKAIGSNTRYLSNAIKLYSGMTINDYINDYRLSYAAVLLSVNPQMSIGDVETESGFSSRTTFSRLFKNKYGMSPSEYKRIAREQCTNC